MYQIQTLFVLDYGRQFFSQSSIVCSWMNLLKLTI